MFKYEHFLTCKLWLSHQNIDVLLQELLQDNSERIDNLTYGLFCKFDYHREVMRKSTVNAFEEEHSEFIPGVPSLPSKMSKKESRLIDLSILFDESGEMDISKLDGPRLLDHISAITIDISNRLFWFERQSGTVKHPKYGWIAKIIRFSIIEAFIWVRDFPASKLKRYLFAIELKYQFGKQLSNRWDTIEQKDSLLIFIVANRNKILEKVLDTVRLTHSSYFVTTETNRLLNVPETLCLSK